MHKWWFVAKDTYKRNITSGAFIFAALLPLIFVAVSIGTGVLFAYLEGGSDAPDDEGGSGATYAVITEDSALEDALAASDASLQFRTDLKAADAKSELKDHAIDGYFEIDTGVTPAAVTYYYQGVGANDEAPDIVTDIVKRYQTETAAKALGVAAADAKALARQTVDTNKIDLEDESDDLFGADTGTREGVRAAVSIATGIVLFFLVAQFAGTIVQEIAREKGSRLVEIVLSSMSVSDHFFGKTLGLVLLLLTVLAFYVGLFAVGLVLIGTQIADFLPVVWQFIRSIWEDTGDVVLWGLLFFVFGFFTYVIFCAFTGSLVTKKEDAGRATTPATLLLLVAFYLNFFGGTSLYDRPFFAVLSHVPFFSPLLMPTRIAYETVGGFELAFALVLHVAFLAFLLWLSLTFYRSNVLTYSDKGLVQAFKQSLALYRSERNNN